MRPAPPTRYAELDRPARRRPTPRCAGAYPGERAGRQPVHTVYVPADRFAPDWSREWGAQRAGRAATSTRRCRSPTELADRVAAKLAREPIEDLRIDFEDGYGVRDDDEEDAAVRAAAAALARPARGRRSSGMRIKSLEAADPAPRACAPSTCSSTRSARCRPASWSPCPRSARVDQVEAMVAALRTAGAGVRAARRRAALRDADRDAAGGARRGRHGHRRPDDHAADGRCTGLHYGTYDYSAARRHRRRRTRRWTTRPPTTPRRSCRWPPPAPACGSPTARPTSCRSATPRRCTRPGQLHARLVRRSLERGFYQGWDLHPAQLPTRYAATYAFFRDGVRRGGRPAARATWTAAAAPACWTSRRPRGRWPASCCAAWTAARSTRPRSAFERSRAGEPMTVRLRAALPAGGPARRASARPRSASRRTDRRHRAVRASRGPDSTSATTPCCCRAWSTPTCTSTSPAAPSGRASPPPPGPPRPAA